MTDSALAILSALVGFLVWTGQRYFERKAAERLHKEKLYGALLDTCVECLGTGNGAPFIIESQRAWLYASDGVLRAINDYLKAFLAYGNAQRSGADDSEKLDAVKDAEGRLRLSIRKELFPSTEISGEWIKEQWAIVLSHPERIQEYLKRRAKPDEEADRGRTPGAP